MNGVDPADYTPPLTRWGHLWRTAICLLISATAWSGSFSLQWRGDPPGSGAHLWNGDHTLFWVDLAGGVLAFVLVFYRRRRPFEVALAIALIGLFSASAAGPATLALVSLATRRRLPQIISVAIVSIITGQLYSSLQPTSQDGGPWLDFTFLVAFTVALCAYGMYVGSRRELIWTLRERARQAESAQELRVEQTRSAERERIAREMHDVLAHRISLVAVHAGALAYRTDLTPEQVRETAELIQGTAHEALTDLRHVLGVLRADESLGDRPQPTLADLACLIAENRDGGMVIDLSDRLAGAEPSEQIGRTLYRVVQEGLTNARKHAPRAHVGVGLAGDPDSGVTVVVRNAKAVGTMIGPTVPGSGLGLVGLRERTELAGGTLEVEDTPESFTVRGWLPWTPR